MKLIKPFKKKVNTVESKRDEPEPLRLFRNMPNLVKVKPNIPKCEAMRGNPRSRVLIVAPPMTVSEYERGIPLTDPDAAFFHTLLKEATGLDTERHCYVISCSRYGLKPNKASTQDVVEYVRQLAQFRLFDLCICVGDDAFKFIFGRGKKPTMNSLAGSTIRHGDIYHLPVFTFPSLQGLVHEETGDKREDRFRADWSNKQQFRFSHLFDRLTKELKNLKLP